MSVTLSTDLHYFSVRSGKKILDFNLHQRCASIVYPLRCFRFHIRTILLVHHTRVLSNNWSRNLNIERVYCFNSIRSLAQDQSVHRPQLQFAFKNIELLLLPIYICCSMRLKDTLLCLNKVYIMFTEVMLTLTLVSIFCGDLNSVINSLLYVQYLFLDVLLTVRVLMHLLVGLFDICTRFYRSENSKTTSRTLI